MLPALSDLPVRMSVLSPVDMTILILSSLQSLIQNSSIQNYCCKWSVIQLPSLEGKTSTLPSYIMLDRSRQSADSLPSCHGDCKLVQFKTMQGWMFAGTTGVSLHWIGSLLGHHPGESPTGDGVSTDKSSAKETGKQRDP